MTSLWATAALAVAFHRARELDARMTVLRSRNFRSGAKELNGSEVLRNLVRGRTTDDLAHDLATTLREFGAHIWVVAMRRQSDGPTTKGRARQFLLERVNGFLDPDTTSPVTG